jgi:hypothetical protein
MSSLQKSRIYLVRCATGEVAAASDKRTGIRARCALSLGGSNRPNRVAGGRAISLFDSVDGGCLSLKRT